MTDPTRCGGFVAEAHHTLCTRRFDCARYLDNTLARPFRISACEGGDAFIHAATVAEHGGAAHPADATPIGVLDANTLRTTRAVGSV
jgi:hypothetical protein